MKRFLVVGFLMMGLAAASCSPRPKAGTVAPDFTLPLLSNESEQMTLSEAVREQPVLLVFWASWCPSCVEEIPALNDLHEKFASKGLRIVGVDVQEDRKDVMDFAKKQPIRYPVLLDQEGKVADRFGLTGVPAAVFVAKGGEILYYGFSLPAHLDQLLHQER